MARETMTRPQASLSACLAAAQADADRHYGRTSPILWQPSARRGPVIAVLATILAAVAAAWWASGDAPPADANRTSDAVSQPRLAAVAPLRAPAPSVEREALELPSSDVLPAFVPSTASATPIAPAAPQPDPASLPWHADPDGWALDPVPIAPVEGHPTERLGNVPEAPDEHDATPGEDSPLDDDVAIESASEPQPVGG